MLIRKSILNGKMISLFVVVEIFAFSVGGACSDTPVPGEQTASEQSPQSESAQAEKTQTEAAEERQSTPDATAPDTITNESVEDKAPTPDKNTPEPQPEPTQSEKTFTEEPHIEPAVPEQNIPESQPEMLPELPPKEQPPVKTCKTDKDCGKRTCLQKGKVCTRHTPICRAGKCIVDTKHINNTTCQPSTGVCKAPTQGCKNLCDCTQGLLCTPGDGKCVAGIVPEYCCDKPGCPTGKACKHASGAPGKCP